MCKYLSCCPPGRADRLEIRTAHVQQIHLCTVNARKQSVWSVSASSFSRLRNPPQVSVSACRPAAIFQDAPALTRRPSKKVASAKAAKSTTPSLSAHNRANVSDSEQLRIGANLPQRQLFKLLPNGKILIQTIKRARGTMKVTSCMKTLPSCEKKAAQLQSCD